MNIYVHEFKSISRSVITWSIAIFAVMLLYMSVFSSFAADAEMVNEMFAEFPDELLAAFGMDNLDLSTVLGYFTFITLFAQVLVAIQAANYGFGLVSIEERELTADFLLTRPVSRPKILTSKLLAALTALAITNAVVWISAFALIAIFSDGRPYDTGILVLLLLTVTFIQLFFLTVALIISLFRRRIRNVTPYSMGLVFGLYVLAAFSSMMGEMPIENITPFKHFEANYIVANGAYDSPLIFLSFALIIISVVGSYFLYSRRDIHSV
ncbi:MAG: ABC transporter permease subunit [Chloroflexota bacterium]|nr:MAG: ABC transporter permease subunit [Chloroflexota bacterium]